MRVVMFAIGVIFALAGLRSLVLASSQLSKAERGGSKATEEKPGNKWPGTSLLFAAVVLLVLGSNLGDRVGSVKLGESGVEIVFAIEPAKLTPQQVAGAQKLQQAKLFAPPQTPANTPATNVSFAILLESTRRVQQLQADVLHQALASEGFIPAPDPYTDLSPGTVVRVEPEGSVTVEFSRTQSLPQLKLRSSTFDFVQFTSLHGTRPGFSLLDAFLCQQGFREDMDLFPLSTPIAPTISAALQQDSSLHIVRSVLGCYGKGGLLDTPSPGHVKGRYILGF